MVGGVGSEAEMRQSGGGRYGHFSLRARTRRSIIIIIILVINSVSFSVSLSVLFSVSLSVSFSVS